MALKMLASNEEITRKTMITAMVDTIGPMAFSTMDENKHERAAIVPILINAKP